MSAINAQVSRINVTDFNYNKVSHSPFLNPYRPNPGQSEKIKGNYEGI